MAHECRDRQMVCAEGRWEMNTTGLKELITDWGVATLLIRIVLSVIAIYPHINDEGNLETNIQYGLDLQQGAWIQLDMRAEVVGYTTDRQLDEFISNLSTSLDAEVLPVDANHLEIRKYFSQSDLESRFSAAGGKITSYQPGVSKSTAESVKR